MRQAVVIFVGSLAVLVLIPLVAALIRRAADATIVIVPAVIVLWFTVAILRGMIKGLFH